MLLFWHMKYTCPMHPAIVRDEPGNCPKCGMKLIPVGSKPTPDMGLGSITWKSYLPLIVIIGAIVIFALVVASMNGGLSVSEFVRFFMAGFFMVFASFKFADWKGFAEGYATYDLLASKFSVYGYAYPFVELFFGLMMLMGFVSPWLLWAEFGVMLFSALGVSIKLLKHEKFQCVCLGTFLKVPLTNVTLVEDFGMAALALAMIYLR